MQECEFPGRIKRSDAGARQSVAHRRDVARIRLSSWPTVGHEPSLCVCTRACTCERDRFKLAWWIQELRVEGNIRIPTTQHPFGCVHCLVVLVSRAVRVLILLLILLPVLFQRGNFTSTSSAQSFTACLPFRTLRFTYPPTWTLRPCFRFVATVDSFRMPPHVPLVGTPLLTPSCVSSSEHCLLAPF